MEDNTITVQTRLGERCIDPDKIVHFPRGLIGYEQLCQFTLLELRPDAPFLILQSLDEVHIGLLVADPFTFIDNYTIHAGTTEKQLLQVDDLSNLAVLVTATIPHGKPEETSINLTGPILINYQERIGLQVPQTEGGFPPHYNIYSTEKNTTEIP